MRFAGAAKRARISEFTGGLTRRVLIAGALVAALVALVVVALADAAHQQQRASKSAEHSEHVLESSLLAERRVVDLETGIRGYSATGDRAFLAPWSAARSVLPTQLTQLHRLVADDPVEARRAGALRTAVDSYISNYTVPFVTRSHPLRGAALTAFTGRGKQFLDALRAQFAAFDATELARQHARDHQADSADNRLLTLGGVAAALVLLALMLFVWFVAGWVALPLRRGSLALGRLAKGERGLHLPERGTDEVQLLARSFNQAVGQLSQRERELERAASELRDAAAYNESVVTSALEAHISMDEEGLITSWNPAAERVFGWSKEEALGAELADLIIPEHLRNAHRRGLERYLRKRESRLLGLRLELTGMRRSGDEFPIQISMAAVEHHDRLRFHAFIADISSRRAAEREVRLLADFVAFTHEAVITMDSDGLITSFNPGAERMFGYRGREVMGRSVLDLQPLGDRRELAEARLARLLAGERVDEQAVSRRRKDGTTIYADLSASPIRNERGEVVGGATILRDVTEQRQTALELAESEERFRLMFEEAPIGMALLDPDGRCLRVNGPLCEILGYSADELLRVSLRQLVHPAAHDASAQLLADVLAGEIRTHRTDLRFLHKDGHTVWARLTVSPVRGSDDRPRYFMVEMDDVTEQRVAEARLRRLSQLVEQSEEAITSKSSDGTITEWNRGAERLYGYTAAEAIGQPMAMVVPADRTGEQLQLLERVLAGETIRQHETVRERKDGSAVEVSLTLSPLFDELGCTSGACVVTRDVSAQKDVERRRERTLDELSDAQRVALVGSWTWDPKTNQASWSDQMYRIFGRDPQLGAAVGDEFLAYVAPEDRDRVGAHYAKRFTGGPKFEFEYWIRRGDGRVREVHAVGYRDPRRDGCYIGTVQDVTELRAAERALRAAEQRLRTIFEHAPIGNALLTLDGRIDQANPAFGELCGRTRTEVEGIRLSELLHPGDVGAYSDSIRALVAGQQEQLSLELRFISATGTAVDIDAHGTLLRGVDGEPTHILCQCHDVSERKRFEAQLQFMADHDPLTGLLNRRKFEAELDRHVAEVRRYGPKGALIVLDIDHFKHVNDALGHNAGDELIVSMATVLRSRLRESDVLARLGGDEFAVLLPHADGQDALEVAQALVDAVRASTTLLGGERYHVTTSAGVTMFEPRAEDLSGEAILVDADLAMYDAKEAGRDQFASYSTSEHRVSRTKARLTWVRRIEQALEDNRFVLTAQPILDLSTGTVCQHELLIRMVDESGDLIPPTAFLYIAERFGLIGRIDEWVSGQAIALIEHNPELTLEVNISGRSLGNETLLEAIATRISASTIDPAKLIFEVTETAAVANVADARAFAQRLRDLGCRFALDDFGAGFGSFYYLKHLPFDYIKIDGEFVQHAATGQIDQLVIEAVVRIARGLGKETIAEFVADARTMRMVKRLGVDYAQGFHVGKPAPLSELTPVASDQTDRARA